MAKKKAKWEEGIYTSYSKLASDLSSGRTDMEMVYDQYVNLQRIAMRRVEIIRKSDLPWAKGTKPFFMKPENIITEGQLAHEYIDVVHFLKRKNTTLKGREAQFRKVQRKLKKQGFNINKRNFARFTRFMDWFYSSKYATMYDSNQDIVTEVFNQPGGNAKLWSQLFDDFKLNTSLGQ